MRRLFKIIIGVLIVLVLFGLFVIIFINNYWKSRIDEKELLRVSEIIDNSESMPPRFYIIHDEIFPGLRNRGAIFGHLNKLKEESKEYELEENPFNISIYEKSSPTMWVYSVLVDNSLLEPMEDSSTIGAWFDIAIGGFTKPEKCFDFFYKNHKYEYKSGDSVEYLKGIGDYSLRLYGKKLEDLSSSELRKIILSVENDKKFKILATPHLY